MKREKCGRRLAGTLLLAVAAAFMTLTPSRAATGVILWDTGTSLSGAGAGSSRAGWRAVPTELFAFEAEPLKAVSDPGYYGRTYSFKGDAAVENQKLLAIFSSAHGRVSIHFKTEAPPSSADPTQARKILEVVPLQSGVAPVKMQHCEIVRNACDEVVLNVAFGADESDNHSALFAFGKNEILEIKPNETMKGMRLLSPTEYGVVPGFVGDDLVFGANAYPSAGALVLPVENVFLALLKGEQDEFVMTWPHGRQQLALRWSEDSSEKRAIASVDFENDGQSFYLAALTAPGLWHREELKPAYLEKDVALMWKAPFPAKWKTQLTEAGLRTRFAFRASKSQIWRGVPGSYHYPAWFDGETAYYHLSKKVPPKGESLIYFLEGEDTPPGIASPVDIMKATLGRPMCDPILDVAGRRLRTHHRRGGDGVHRACTCGCTEAIQAIFEAGEETSRRDEVQQALADMNYFVQCHVERIQEYLAFATNLTQFLHAQASTYPPLKPFAESIDEITQKIPQQYNVQKDNMKSLEHAAELTRQTMALTSHKTGSNLAAYMKLLNAWRAMGGAQDYVVAQCHMIARQIFQEAGYGCVHNPQAVALAKEIRARCRQVLRNPDGYEIWADY